MKANIKYQDLIYRLGRLDEDAYLMYDNSDRRFNCILVGGSALILMDCISRATHDIDVISCSREITNLLEKYDFNQRVQTYINNFPYNYEDRFKKIEIETKIIDYFTASLEDIVIAKLFSYRDTDLKDITEPYILEKIDWEVLEKLSIESKDSALNDNNYMDFKFKYDDYVGRFKSNERINI